MNLLLLILAGVASVAGAMWVLQDSRRLVWCIVLAFFSSRVAIDIGGLTLRADHIVGALCAIDLVARIGRNRGGRLTQLARVSALALVFWLLWGAVVSTFVAPIPSASLAIMVWLALNALTALWISRTPQLLTYLIKVLCIVGLVVALIALGQYALATALNMEIFGVQVDPAYGGYAVYGFSYEANVLAGVMCLTALVAMFNPGSTVPSIVSMALPVLAPIVMLAAHTRATLVAYAIGVCVIVVSRRSARKRAAVVLAGATAAFAWILASSADSGLGKFAQIFDIESGTGAVRFRSNEVALDQWSHSEHGWIGLGMNSFGQRNYDLTVRELARPSYLGNLPVQILYDGGLVSVVVLAIAVLTVLLGYMKIRRATLPIALAVAYLTFSVATSTLWLLETWLLVGCAWAGLSWSHSRGEPGEPAPTWGRTGRLRVGPVRSDRTGPR